VFDDPESSRGRLRALLLCLALVALPFLPGLRGEFVYDDLAMVVRNPRTTGLERVPEIVTSPMLGFLDPRSDSEIGYWRPLAGLALIAGNALGGGTPLGFKVLNLLLHLAATAVAFRLAERLTRSRTTAFLAALLFGLHPTHVECVTWVSAINDPLFGLFALLALDSFVAWRDAGSRGSAWKTAAWLLPALLSKEMAAAVVPMAVALDLGRRLSRGGREPILRAYAPMAIVLAFYVGARMAVFGSWLAGFDRTTTDFGVVRLRLTQLRFELLGSYLWLLVWPRDLNLFRPFRPELPFGDPEFLRALACILVFAAAAVWLWKRRDGLAFACLLLVAAGVSPAVVRPESLGSFPLSDRFLYLPALGWAILLATAVSRLAPRRVATALLALVALAYGVRAEARTGFWRDEPTLFAKAVEQSPRVPYVHWGCARSLLERYRKTNDADLLRKAHDEAQAALDLLEAAQKGDQSIRGTVDDHVQSNLALAWCLYYEAAVDQFHDYATVLRVFEAIASRYPRSPEAQAGIAVVSTKLHRFEEAEAAFQKAIALNPNSADVYRNLGLLRATRGDFRGAASAFEEALRHRPDAPEDLTSLARARAELGDLDGALAAAERAATRAPRSAEPLVVQGTIAAKRGDLDRAEVLVRKALRLEPDDGQAMFLESKILFTKGEKSGAKVALLRAAELLPTSFEVHYNAGALFLQENDFPSAFPYLIRAYDLRSDDEAGRRLKESLVSASIQDPDLLCRLAAADADRGDTVDALDWLDRAIEVKADHGPALYMKAMLLAKGGDAAAVEPLLRRACNAMPGSFDAHEQLGELLARASREKEALPFLERALEIATEASKSMPGAQESLARLREQVERIRAASK
jgi:tetratricopeptide (TPR) repeat protein